MPPVHSTAADRSRQQINKRAQSQGRLADFYLVTGVFGAPRLTNATFPGPPVRVSRGVRIMLVPHVVAEIEIGVCVVRVSDLEGASE